MTESDSNGGHGAPVYLITGIQAAGKSTVAQALAERFDRSAHVRGDTFRRFVVRGFAPMSPDPSEEALEQLRLRHRLAAQAADGYAAAGFTTVLQDVILGDLLPYTLSHLHTRPRYVVVLAPAEKPWPTAKPAAPRRPTAPSPSPTWIKPSTPKRPT